LTTAARLRESAEVAFMGDTKGGSFDIPRDVAGELLAAGPNPNGKPNSDVVVPWMNAMDLTRRSREMFIIDFGVSATEHDASLYEAPFEYVRTHVKAEREGNNRKAYARRWWIHVEPRPALRSAIAPLTRFIITPTTARHRIFAWGRRPLLPDHKLIVIAREDDYAFGVLHSRVHELWSLRKIARQGIGNDPVYAPTFAFETFPFPWPLDTPDQDLTTEQRKCRDAIAVAGRELDHERSLWLNPPELVRAEPDLVQTAAPRLVPVSARAADELKKRTLTNLYNARPGWLDLAHRTLDEAVLAAYGWPSDIAEPELLDRLLKLNRIRAASDKNVRHHGSGPRTEALFKHLPVTLKPERGSGSKSSQPRPAAVAAEKRSPTYGPRKPPKSAAPTPQGKQRRAGPRRA
jgi:hypothetical protein